MILIGIASLVHFFIFFLKSEYRGYTPLYILLTIIVVYGVFRRLYLWYHYFSISVPARPKLKTALKVDVLTTYFPGEPVEMIINTLKAIKKIRYPHTTYLCDEANDPFLKDQCAKLGVVHVTRNNRIDAKAGNINNALRQASGEICVILDPDHIPKTHFLEAVLPHFNDERIGFVQIVQGYYNKYETLVARGAAEQTFQFYGPMMMTMNSYGTVNAIGANCTFRRAALDSIGGHAPGLAEDLHTAMLLHAEGWTSVYVPEFLAKGLVPTELTSYYKQQLKWARGTFELLYSVYPKIFSKLSLRQKIHYALVPFHYLIGFIYFLAFLIPILSLFLSKMPWTGNILYFIAMGTPVVMSSLLIRIYIQKWVIEENERGFHMVGGILQIITWWVYALGVIYTFTRKKIPFIPTPKDEQKINYFVLIPNVSVGFLSITAIAYGLKQDFTPFTLVMSFFAAMNALFMFFSIYLSVRLTNRNKILRTNLRQGTVGILTKIKRKLRSISNGIFKRTRPVALPFLIITVLAAVFWMRTLDRNAWENVNSDATDQNSFAYLGVFNPSDDNGLSDLNEIGQLQEKLDVDFQILSFYVAWEDLEDSEPLADYIEAISDKGLIPMMTWEPWSSNFSMSESIPELSNETRILHYIEEGIFDDYILKMALLLKKERSTVFLRFAHEFDNPAYPWSMTGNNTPEEFIAAWKHVHDIFTAERVDNVVWVWNPWHADKAMDYYPGDSYVDWIGTTLLNYGPLDPNGKQHDFKSLYNPFHEVYKNLRKPVLLAEFGSLKLGGNQKRWMAQAFNAIDRYFHQIKAVVFFNSRFDKNLPTNSSDKSAKYLDWTLSELPVRQGPRSSKTKSLSTYTAESSSDSITAHREIFPKKAFRGVCYKKSDNWLDNYYIASKEVLQKDFDLMEKVGINTIKVMHTPVYNYNLLKYAEESELDILYSFWISDTLNFLSDSERKSKVKEKILQTIGQLKDNRTIVGWNIANEPWSKAHNIYDKLNQGRQREAYLIWLKQLVAEIKEIDPNRFLSAEMELSKSTPEQMEEVHEKSIKIDAIGLIVKDSELFTELFEQLKETKIPFIINSIDPIAYSKVHDHIGAYR